MYSDVKRKWSAEEPLEGFEAELETEPEESEAEDLSLTDEAPAEESEAIPQEAIQSSDPVLAYLREIGCVPLLSREREVELGKQIETCRNEIFNVLFSTPFAVRHVLELGAAVAAEELELRQITVSIAKKHLHRGLAFLDLIQEGNLGMMRAVDKFDYRLGYRFSTYATWWIRQHITRGLIDTGRMIRIPVHRVELQHKIFQCARGLQRKLGRQPRPEELAKEMGYTVADLLKLIQTQGEPVSLQTPIWEDGDELEDFLEDRIGPTPEEQALQAKLRDEVRKVLAILTPRQEQVLRMRFGIDQRRDYTLEEVGEKFAVTRERIRQIEQKSLQILRNPQRRKPIIRTASELAADASLN
jgi:RNA polymerase primary sigma factor